MPDTHEWNVTPREARALQERLRGQVRVEPLKLEGVGSVAGVDLSFDRGSSIVYAGVVVLSMPSLVLLERSGIQTVAGFPYIPGLLSFRESPPVLEAWARLRTRPDATICDGQGLAHPRRFGIACHLGLLLDMPSVGCAKSILVGTHEPVGEAQGDWAPLVDGGEVIGAALRTRPGVSPVYVSVGHRCDLESAIRLVLACGGPTRVPETTRRAHLFVNALRRGEETAVHVGEEGSGSFGSARDTRGE